ncbi:MAG: flavin reductase [Deltaproteobacteria bacterium]|nr:MAG: flavin reductase [Deltaproteobacteria bacterium]
MKENIEMNTLHKLTTGIYVLTTKKEDEINGMIATWVSQVSSRPPLIVVCVKNVRYSHHMIKDSGIFVINILRDNQKDLVTIFKSRVKTKSDKFKEIPYFIKDTGAPIIKDALAYLECKVTSSIDPGDHTIFLGEVIHAEMLRDGQPLNIHHLGKYYQG